jgi:hypothetical protein
LLRLITGTLEPVPIETAGSGAGALTLVLVLRAFASGCTALTGVEAISNGIPAFQKPEADNAGKTLTAMAALLATMFLGFSVLARAVEVIPAEDQTVVSQVGRQVFGDGVLYLVLQIATAMILILAANTSFADFPRLSAILARDRYLPRQLTNLGDRLVFTNGILALGALAAFLVIVFRGQTHRLIPLYAVGVFLAFTLSQSGMVRHWYKQGGPGWRWKATVNGIGAAATSVVLLIVVATKFTHGAWIVVLLIPTFVWGFRTIKQHYNAVAEQLTLSGMVPEPWTDAASHRRHKVVVPVSGMHRGTLVALRFARSLSSDVAAVVVDVDPKVTSNVRARWPTWGHDVELVVLDSPYRSTVVPLLAYLDQIEQQSPELGGAVVVLPEFVPARWWHELLHNHTARLIKRVLVYRRGKIGKDRVIIDVPYHLQR